MIEILMSVPAFGVGISLVLMVGSLVYLAVAICYLAARGAAMAIGKLPRLK